MTKTPFVRQTAETEKPLPELPPSDHQLAQEELTTADRQLNESKPVLRAHPHQHLYPQVQLHLTKMSTLEEPQKAFPNPGIPKVTVEDSSKGQTGGQVELHPERRA